MPRIEIELTSARPDGTWTWRAAGAKQPKGTLDAAVLPGGAKVGDVLRAEADIDIDGITVRSAVPATPKKGAAPERIEIIGSGRDEPPVTTNMRGGVEAGGNDRGRRGDRDSDRGREGGPGRPGGGGGPGGPGGRRPEGAGRAPSTVDRGERARREAASRAGADGRPGRDRPGRDRPAGDRPVGDRPVGDRPVGDRPRRPAGGRPAGDRPVGPARDRPAGDRPAGPAGGRPARPARRRPSRVLAAPPVTVRRATVPGASVRRASGASGRPGPRPVLPEAPKPKAKRLQPGRVYRDAVLAELSPERKAVAEQILRGGIPAVRQAVEEQNAKAREEGGPEIKADALLAMAEELLPALKAAEWRDRADAAVVIVDEISVRDLRSVVLGADTARDEEGRALAAQLREALDRRAAAERQTWVDEITSSLDEGRIVRALRISGRPPEPGVRFPAELAKRLSDASGDALAPDTTADRWAAVLEAVVASPVRRTITPKGLPAEPGEALSRALHLAAPRIPALGALMGITPRGPAPPSDPSRLPRRSPRRRGPPAGPRPAARPRRPAFPAVLPADPPSRPPAAPAPPRRPPTRRAPAPTPPAPTTEARRARPARVRRAATASAAPESEHREPAVSSAPGRTTPWLRTSRPRSRGRARPRRRGRLRRTRSRSQPIPPLRLGNRRPSRWSPLRRRPRHRGPNRSAGGRRTCPFVSGRHPGRGRRGPVVGSSSTALPSSRPTNSSAGSVAAGDTLGDEDEPPPDPHPSRRSGARSIRILSNVVN